MHVDAYKLHFSFFFMIIWMSYLQRGWAGLGIPGKSPWWKAKKINEVEESQSSTLPQGAELLPQSSHGETEGGGHTHTHTHACLTGECCVCEVGLAWRVGGKKDKVWEGSEEKKCCGTFLKVVSSWEHLSANVVTSHDVCLWHEVRIL